MTGVKKPSYLTTLAVLIIVLAAHQSNGQTKPSPTTFHPGQTMYIVAFHKFEYPYLVDQPETGDPRDYINLDLDAERKVRKRIEQWTYFKVAEKLSQADFIFLVQLDEGSIEGLAIPFEAYRQHFKEKFDLDELREAAFGRYLIGPLKLATISRLADRLVKQLQQKLGQPRR
ncbi:MAG TPA: hypothetical protein VL866_01005 [Pyrinomonadaceae bacterium]|nr:hypothetical protein [Pyrinomonadaceae bacterium]